MGVPLIDLHAGQLPQWKQNIKRILDIVFSILAFLILIPVFIYIFIRQWTSNKGSMFYTQQRVGYKGQPFKMFKFRSMVENAEPNGPMLSSENDPRAGVW